MKAKELIKANTYIIEYVGEVIDKTEYMERVDTIYKDDIHHYGLLLSKKNVIDAHRMGNDSRFINHSCEPNAEIQKWTVNGHTRMVLLAKRDIQANEEITFHYNFVHFNAPQKCECESKKCKGFITQKTNTKSKSDTLQSLKLKPSKSSRNELQSQAKHKTSSKKNLPGVLKTSNQKQKNTKNSSDPPILLPNSQSAQVMQPLLINESDKNLTSNAWAAAIVKPSSSALLDSLGHSVSPTTSITEPKRLSVKSRLGVHPNDLTLVLERKRALKSGLNVSSSITSATSEEMRSSHGLVERAISFGGGVDTDAELVTKRYKKFADDEAIPYCVEKVKKSDLTTASVEPYEVQSKEILLKLLVNIKLEWAQNHDYKHAHEQLESIKKDLTVSRSFYRHFSVKLMS